MAQRGYLTNLASEFHVISQRSRLGYDASLTLGNKKRVDITVVLKEGLAKTIDVKAVAGKMDWLLGNSAPHEAQNHFVVLVTYDGRFNDVHWMPRTWVFHPSKSGASPKSQATGSRDSCHARPFSKAIMTF